MPSLPVSSLITTNIARIKDPYVNRVQATYGWRWHSGNDHPYFTVIGDAWRPHQNLNTDPVTCGAIHELIAKAFGFLKPLIELHLSDAITGEPMYAASNGRFTLNNHGVQAAADYLRVPANVITTRITAEADDPDQVAQMDALVEAMRPTWRQQAHDAISRYGLKDPEKA